MLWYVTLQYFIKNNLKKLKNKSKIFKSAQNIVVVKFFREFYKYLLTNCFTATFADDAAILSIEETQIDSIEKLQIYSNNNSEWATK